MQAKFKLNMYKSGYYFRFALVINQYQYIVIVANYCQFIIYYVHTCVFQFNIPQCVTF